MSFKFLVVDDEADIREILSSIIESQVLDSTILEADNGSKAIEMIQENPDLDYTDFFESGIVRHLSEFRYVNEVMLLRILST